MGGTVMLKRLTSVVAILFAASISSDAIAGPMTFECTFPISSTFDEGNVEVEKGDFKMQFLVDADKAYMIGNNGANEVMTIGNDGGVTFIEVTGTGNVMMTTFNNNGAVHSRHTIIGETLLPSQYYGTCIKK
jgi:hypothetical protein